MGPPRLWGKWIGTAAMFHVKHRRCGLHIPPFALAGKARSFRHASSPTNNRFTRRGHAASVRRHSRQRLRSRWVVGRGPPSAAVWECSCRGGPCGRPFFCGAYYRRAGTEAGPYSLVTEYLHAKRNPRRPSGGAPFSRGPFLRAPPNSPFKISFHSAFVH